MMYANLNIVAICFLTIILSIQSSAQQQASNNIKSEPINSKEQIQTENRDIWPVVRVDKVNNNSVTDVHVPIFFDMTSTNGRNTSKLDLSVMHGLVTVNQDKAKDSNGTISGPLTVTVFGIPVYSGRARGSPVVGSGGRPRRVEDVLEHPFGDISNMTTPIMRDLYLNSRKTNEKILRSFSDLFSRAAKKIEESIETLSPGPGGPVDDDVAKGLVKPSTFNKEDFKPRESMRFDNTLASDNPVNKPQL